MDISTNNLELMPLEDLTRLSWMLQGEIFRRTWPWMVAVLALCAFGVLVKVVYDHGR